MGVACRAWGGQTKGYGRKFERKDLQGHWCRNLYFSEAYEEAWTQGHVRVRPQPELGLQHCNAYV